MSITDSVANMLTRIRNANSARKDKVDVKSSKTNMRILEILKNERFLNNFKAIPDEKQGMIRVYLKFDEEGNSALQGLKRVSKPGLRIYAKTKKIPRVLSGLGIVIISTPRGVMTGLEAREKGLGGEILCYAW